MLNWRCANVNVLCHVNVMSLSAANQNSGTDIITIRKWTYIVYVDQDWNYLRVKIAGSESTIISCIHHTFYVLRWERGVPVKQFDNDQLS